VATSPAFLLRACFGRVLAQSVVDRFREVVFRRTSYRRKLTPTGLKFTRWP
jgi:hypothetical protein